MDELIESIAEHGVLQPIRVRRDPESPEKEWRYIVVSGSRRLAASETVFLRGGPGAVKVQRIPCVLIDVDPEEAYIEAVAENVAREDLTGDELYRACERIHRMRPDWKPVDIGRRIGVSRQRISTFFRVADDDVVGAAVEEGVLSSTAALEVARIGDKETREEIISYARQQGNLSVGEAKALRHATEAAPEPTPLGKYLPDADPPADPPTGQDGKYLPDPVAAAPRRTPPPPPPDTSRPSPFTLGAVETGADHAVVKEQLAARPEGQRNFVIRAALVTLGNLARSIESFCESKANAAFTPRELEPLRLAWRKLGRFLGELPE